MAKPKLGSGARAKALEKKISAYYEKKGKSPDEAEKIAAATQAVIGRKKYGKKKYQELAAKGRKEAS